MEEERKIKENTGNMLKQALERRQTEQLSSNFSYRMMERIHLEAEKQTKRKTSIGWLCWYPFWRWWDLVSTYLLFISTSVLPVLCRK